MNTPVEFISVLNNQQRVKQDESNDELFYSMPRFVQHLDGGFRKELTNLYSDRIEAGTIILDLMSSWVSHLPASNNYKEVIGHGLNEQELKANKQLSSYWLQNLNVNQHLPLADCQIDTGLIVAGWQYLQKPEAVASELFRVVKPGGILIVSFSNRMFSSKAPLAWLESSDRERLNLISKVVRHQGWHIEELVSKETVDSGPLKWFAGKGDPFFSVIARKPT